jgi:hypothetical protein
MKPPWPLEFPDANEKTPSNHPALQRPGFDGQAAQILAGVSNNHRLAVFGQHRYRKAATQGRDFSDPRRNTQSARLNRRHPQIHRCGFDRGGETFFDLKFSGHE